MVSLAMIESIDREGEPAAPAYMNFLKAGSSRPIMDVLREMEELAGLSPPMSHSRQAKKQWWQSLFEMMIAKVGNRTPADVRPNGRSYWPERS